MLNTSDTVDMSNYVDNGEWELVESRAVRNVIYYRSVTYFAYCIPWYGIACTTTLQNHPRKAAASLRLTIILMDQLPAAYLSRSSQQRSWSRSHISKRWCRRSWALKQFYELKCQFWKFNLYVVWPADHDHNKQFKTLKKFTICICNINKTVCVM